MRNSYIAFLLLLLLVSANARAQDASGCASTLHELRKLVGDPSFPHRWEEVAMGDGKPLVVSVVERNGALLIEFMKTGEGLWAEISSAVVCRKGADLEARMSKEQIRLGPASNLVLRFALANGGVFTLQRHVPNQLQIATHGWSGRFVPAAMD